MSLYELDSDDQSVQQPKPPGKEETTGYLELMDAAFWRDALSDLTNSKISIRENLYTDKIERYNSFEGNDFYKEIQEYKLSTDPMGKLSYDEAVGIAKLSSEEQKELQYQMYDRFFTKRLSEDKRLQGVIETRGELEQQILEEAAFARRNYVKKKDNAPDNWISYTMDFLGGAGAQFTDPTNIKASLLGAPAAVRLLPAMLIEGAINAGVEAYTTPGRAEFREEIGDPMTPEEALTNIGFGFVFGAGIGGLARGVNKLLALDEADKLSIMAETARKNGDTESARLFDFASDLSRNQEYELNRITKEVGDDSVARAFNEVNAAMREGRAIDFKKIDITDDVFKKIDVNKIKSPAMRNAIETLLDIAQRGSEAATGKADGLSGVSKAAENLSSERKFDGISFDSTERIKNAEQRVSDRSSGALDSKNIEALNSPTKGVDIEADVERYFNSNGGDVGDIKAFAAELESAKKNLEAISKCRI